VNCLKKVLFSFSSTQITNVSFIFCSYVFSIIGDKYVSVNRDLQHSCLLSWMKRIVHEINNTKYPTYLKKHKRHPYVYVQVNGCETLSCSVNKYFFGIAIAQLFEFSCCGFSAPQLGIYMLQWIFRFIVLKMSWIRSPVSSLSNPRRSECKSPIQLHANKGLA
jgi:hypothetical protein